MALTLGARRFFPAPIVGSVAALLLAGSMMSSPAAVAESASPPKLFAETWINGTNSDEPATQVQALDRDTFVIRQSVKTNFEAPFIYLIFGRDKALLVDTGAEGGSIRQVVDKLIGEWLVANQRTEIPLAVAHSHSHGDHGHGHH